MPVKTNSETAHRCQDRNHVVRLASKGDFPGEQSANAKKPRGGRLRLHVDERAPRALARKQALRRSSAECEAAVATAFMIACGPRAAGKLGEWAGPGWSAVAHLSGPPDFLRSSCKFPLQSDMSTHTSSKRKDYSSCFVRPAGIARTDCIALFAVQKKE